MATKQLMWVLFGIFVISAWALGSAIQAGAETMSYKNYTWVTKYETVPIGDVEGHTVGLGTRGAFYVFENGEVATVNQVSTDDFIKNSGSYMRYLTINFQDGSTIIVKSEGTYGGERPTIEAKSSRGQGDSRESRGLRALKSSFFHLKKGKPAEKDMVKALSPTPYLPSDFSGSSKSRRSPD